MKLVAERRTRLSVAVRLADGAAPHLLPGDELRLRLSGASREPLTHCAGYWLILNATPGKQTLSWTCTHYQDGQLSVQVDPLLPSAPVVELTLVPLPPVSFALASLARSRVGRSYRQPLALQGGKLPFHYTATGLPPGLFVRQATGTIEGTPTRRDSYEVTLGVSDVDGTNDRKTFRLSVTA